jgi:hypothetical protein
LYQNIESGFIVKFVPARHSPALQSQILSYLYDNKIKTHQVSGRRYSGPAAFAIKRKANCRQQISKNRECAYLCGVKGLRFGAPHRAKNQMAPIQFVCHNGTEVAYPTHND